MATMCDSAVWSESTDMLGTMIDQKLVVWYYPGAMFVDKDLVGKTKFIKEARCVSRAFYPLIVPGLYPKMSTKPYAIPRVRSAVQSVVKQQTWGCSEMCIWVCWYAVSSGIAFTGPDWLTFIQTF